MNCSDVRKILPEQIEGNSPSGQQALIEEHLHSCEQCRLYAADLEKTIKTLQALDEIEPPAWLTAEVMKKIRADAMPKKRWIEKLFFPLYIKLPIEALATLLITVAAIVIYKNMGPELQKMEGQPQVPVIKSMPAGPEKEIQKQETKEPQRLRDEVKHKGSIHNTEIRELKTLKEEKPVEQYVSAPVTSPVPAPASSSAPSPAPVTNQFEAGNASGMAARDEVMQRAAPAARRSELSTEKKVDSLATYTVTVKALDAARREIETYLARNNGEMKMLHQSESRIIISVKLDPTKTDKFLAHLGNLGTMKEDRQALSMQSGLFRLVIEKQ